MNCPLDAEIDAQGGDLRHMSNVMSTGFFCASRHAQRHHGEKQAEETRKRRKETVRTKLSLCSVGNFRTGQSSVENGSKQDTRQRTGVAGGTVAADEMRHQEKLSAQQGSFRSQF